MRVLMTALLCTWAAAGQAGVNVWTNFGPEGGASRQIVAHPSNVNRVYAVGSGRVFRSDDAGSTWQLRDRGLPDGDWITTLEVAPSNGDVIYAWMRLANKDFSNVYVSNNAGSSWKRTAFSGIIRDFSVSTSNPADVAVLTDATGANAILYSTTSGARVEPLTATGLLPVGAQGRAIALQGTNLYVYGSSSLGGPVVYKRTSLTGAFTATAASRDIAVPDMRIAPNNASRIYISPYRFVCLSIDPCSDGLVSSNAGASWVVAPDLFFTPWISPIAGNTILQGGGNIVSVSTGATIASTTLVNFASRFFFDVSGHPNYPTTANFYTSTPGEGLRRHVNNGTSSSAINTGFQAMRVLSLAYVRPATALGTAAILAGRSNFVPQIEYPGHYPSDGVSRYSFTPISINGWADSVVPTAKSVPAMASDPTTSGSTARALAGSADENSIWRSINGGVNFTEISLPSLESVLAIEYDRRSCSPLPITGPCVNGPLQTVFIGGKNNSFVTAGASNSGSLLKSVDGGVTWANSASGIPKPPVGYDISVTALAVNPNNSTVFAGTSVARGLPVTSYTSGVFRSTNGGSTWTRVSTGIAVQSFYGANATVNITALAIDPVTEEIYAGTESSGMYVSSDNGATWTNTRFAGRRITQIRIAGNRIFVSTTGDEATPGGVFRSRVNSLVFESISAGLPASGVEDLLVVGDSYTAATARGVFNFFSGPDDDEDNVNTATENAAPNSGDGDLDGTADSLQTQTSSFLINSIGTPEQDGQINRAVLGRTNYVTADIESAFRGGGCEQINNSYGIDSSSLIEDSRGFDTSDLGIISIELRDCLATSVIVTLDDGNFANPNDWRWRNYGPLSLNDDTSLGWYTFAGATQLDNKRWRLTLNAGQPGVYNTDNERLLLRGGPAFLQDQAFRNGFE